MGYIGINDTIIDTNHIKVVNVQEHDDNDNGAHYIVTMHVGGSVCHFNLDKKDFSVRKYTSSDVIGMIYYAIQKANDPDTNGKVVPLTKYKTKSSQGVPYGDPYYGKPVVNILRNNDKAAKKLAKQEEKEAKREMKERWKKLEEEGRELREKLNMTM